VISLEKINYASGAYSAAGSSSTGASSAGASSFSSSPNLNISLIELRISSFLASYLVFF
jgi:hypothetical protein